MRNWTRYGLDIVDIMVLLHHSGFLLGLLGDSHSHALGAEVTFASGKEVKVTTTSGSKVSVLRQEIAEQLDQHPRRLISSGGTLSEHVIARLGASFSGLSKHLTPAGAPLSFHPA